MFPFHYERKIMQKMSLQQARNVNGGFSFGSLFGSIFGSKSLVSRGISALTGCGGPSVPRLFS
jgi:hypothetical protein